MSNDPINRWSMDRRVSLGNVVTIVVLLIGGVATWYELRNQVSTLALKIENLDTRVEDFRLFMSDRYTGRDAERDFVPLRDGFADHENRIRQLERLGRGAL